MKRRFWKKALGAALLVAILCLFGAGSAFAGTSKGLPWESSLTILSDSLTGPVAFALGLFMIICGFCAVAFTGADMGGWVRWVAVAAILIGMLGAAPTVLELMGLKQAMLL